jgi:hypothetical protein
VFCVPSSIPPGVGMRIVLHIPAQTSVEFAIIEKKKQR